VGKALLNVLDQFVIMELVFSLKDLIKDWMISCSSLSIVGALGHAECNCCWRDLASCSKHDTLSQALLISSSDAAFCVACSC
jgi:hypothetical protein